MHQNPALAEQLARVLIVDDERQNRQSLEVMLAPEGYLLQTAAGGEEALAMVAQQPPDLILLDLMMPGMDGYQVTSALKSNIATKNIPIIIITALDHRNVRMLGLSAGAEEFLTKPVDRAELCVRVRNLLRLRAYGHYVERLEEVEQLKRGFLSTVSHELRTPLTSIRGSLGLLASGAVGALSDEGLQVVAVAERNAIRLMALIDDILDLERLETGKIALQFARVPVEAILRRAMESLATFGEARDVTVEAPEVSAVVWADADRIVQVLVNLLSNAVKFSPPHGVVTIGVSLQEGWVEFRVSDQGRGVPAAQQRSIFERFRQVETSDAREKGGTGLGLAICKSIIEQHGGAIGVLSEAGAGSAFWFRVATSSKQVAPPAERPILVCADRRGPFDHTIREAGYAVITVPTDDAAWAVLQRTRVAAVLTRTDSALTARIRTDPALARVPIMLFGNPDGLSPELLSDSLVFVLPEHAGSHELLAAIREALERGRPAAPAYGPATLVPS